jgi:hypothetical protein
VTVWKQGWLKSLTAAGTVPDSHRIPFSGRPKVSIASPNRRKDKAGVAGMQVAGQKKGIKGD